MKIARPAVVMAAALACAVTPALAGDQAARPAAVDKARTLTLTTKSDVARAKLRELQQNIESFRFAQNQKLVDEILAADPDFAMGRYYASATTFPPKLDELAKARELAKNASEGERRFIEAMALARGDEPEDSIEPLLALTRDYPGERVPLMILGQIYSGLGRNEEARKAFEQAIALDPSTPRAWTLAANLHLVEGNYDKARAMLTEVLPKMPEGAAPVQVRYGIAFSHLYEGDPDAALASLRTLLGEYEKSGAAAGFPEVFIWNSIARINLEHGRTDEAMKAYAKGFESVPGSSLDEQQKTIWRGRLLHGQARTLARMGQHDEAWKHAAEIKKMIDEAGKDGEPFVPAWHYVAGYLKLEAGDAAAAITHLEQADQTDPFHRLLLARAYEKAGDAAKAKKTYQEVVDSKTNNLERALAYPEAKKKLM